MNALVFLTVRSFFNGVKRAVTSARRLIGLIFFIGYYVLMVARPFDRKPDGLTKLATRQPLSMPPLDTLDAIVFGLFAFFSFMLVLNVLGYRGGFKPADVDVLFPTPVSPRVVLFFRIVRDYLLTLLIPLFFAIFGWRGVNTGISAIIANFPEHGSLAFRAITVAWLLMALCWVSIGYAASMFVNRSDLESDRNKRIIGYGIAAILVALGVYATMAFRQSPSLYTAYYLSHSIFFRTVFFTATAATALVMAPLEGDLLQGVLAFAAMAGIIGVSLAIALTQVGWLYDQAAAKGFGAQNLRNLQRSGDLYGMLAEQARQGKVRPSRLARGVNRWRPRGGLALVWKDFLLQARGSLWSIVLFLPVTIFLVIMPQYATVDSSGPAASSLLFLFQGMTIFMMAMTANSGVIEMLKRVDVQKPLPFTPGVIIFWEIAAKAVPVTLISWIASASVLVVRPSLWDSSLAAVLMAGPLAVLLVSTIFLVTVLFPDVDDPTQRGFRSLIMLLGLAIFGLPSTAVFAGLLVFAKLSPIVAAIPFVLINGAVAAGVCAVTGSLYASFNPSE